MTLTGERPEDVPPEEAPFLEELTEFLECVGAHLEWHQLHGTVGLPRDPGAKARVEAWLEEQGLRGPLQDSSRGSGPSASAGARTRATPVRTSHDDADGSSAQGSQAPGPSRSSGLRSQAQGQAPVPSLGLGAHPEQEAAPPVAGSLGGAVARSPNRTPTNREPSLPLGRLPVVDARVANASLDELRQMVSECTSCALHSGRKQTVFSRGQGSSRICFVGEGPGAEEDEQGEPFVGAAGQLLDRMITAMGLGRDEVYVCNVVKCRPPNNRKPEPTEMAACAGYLSRQIELLDPEVIVALGGTAVAGLLGLTEGITRLRGSFRLYQGRIPVMPTFHPAYLLRTPGAKREVWADLKAVLQHVGRPLPKG